MESYVVISDHQMEPCAMRNMEHGVESFHVILEFRIIAPLPLV
jgi:hypothetical protein